MALDRRVTWLDRLWLGLGALIFTPLVPGYWAWRLYRRSKARRATT